MLLPYVMRRLIMDRRRFSLAPIGGEGRGEGQATTFFEFFRSLFTMFSTKQDGF
jgi:hypothetical protein